MTIVRTLSALIGGVVFVVIATAGVQARMAARWRRRIWRGRHG